MQSVKPAEGLAEMLPGSQPIAYHALAGGWWQAVIVAERMSGAVDIEIPATNIRLSRIIIYTGKRQDCPRGQAWRMVETQKQTIACAAAD